MIRVEFKDLKIAFDEVKARFTIFKNLDNHSINNVN